MATTTTTGTGTSNILLIILAILLPPLAVALKEGIGFNIVLNIILCLFAWLPGVIHALYVVLK